MAEQTHTRPEVEVVPDPAEAQEEYGLRVVWQSEDERIEAAEFLLATRMQEDARRRTAAALAARRRTGEPPAPDAPVIDLTGD